jgi:hypothetical protein
VEGPDAFIAPEVLRFGVFGLASGFTAWSRSLDGIPEFRLLTSKRLT